MSDRKPREGKDAPRCPICGRPRDAAHRPFCSARCADVDLSRWLTGAYVIAGESGEEDDEPSENRRSDA